MHRREFLAGCAGAALWAWPMGVSAEPFAAGADWRLRLSTSTIQFSRLPLEQACERIAKLGFEAIDIWAAYEGCPHLDQALKLGPEGLKALLARCHLQLCSFSVYIGGYARYAELLGKAGGGIAIEGSAGPCAPGELRTRMKAFLESLKPLVDLAEKNQSYLAIENHGQSLLDGLDSFQAFVELNSSLRLGLAVAPYHLQASKASVEEAIRICGSQLFFFYAWQNQPGIGQLPGHGPTEFRPWLEALRAVHYRGFVNPFMHGHPSPDEMATGLMKARAYLMTKA